MKSKLTYPTNNWTEDRTNAFLFAVNAVAAKFDSSVAFSVDSDHVKVKVDGMMPSELREIEYIYNEMS